MSSSAQHSSQLPTVRPKKLRSRDIALGNGLPRKPV